MNHINLIRARDMLVSENSHICANIDFHFKRFFGTVEEGRIGLKAEIWDDAPDLLLLEDQITEEEVKREVWTMRSNKSPSPDGFPLFFSKHYWELVKSDLIVP